MDESASGNKHVCVIYDHPGFFKRCLQFPECLANRIIRFDDVDMIDEISGGLMTPMFVCVSLILPIALFSTVNS
jgi:hypothetical protein